MTPIEIFKAWREGKKLEYLGDTVTGLQFRVWTGEGLTAYHHDYHGKVKEIPEVSIKRKTFDFDEARKRLAAGKIITRESVDLSYQLLLGNLLVHEGRGNWKKWSMTHGYPIDWPDAQDFYEVAG